MSDERQPDSPLETPARRRPAMNDVWERTLEQIGSTFGRIVYLASLRNENTGRYRHFGLAQLYGEDEANRVLAESHERIFTEWLNFGLERQKRDLERYLEEAGDDRSTVLETWSTLAPYRSLIPAGAGEAERHLYAADFETILELLWSELAS